ncbi:hypothetical protein OAX78_00680 [Planctomycetota bacterium]|nr:hypothetical protein [Planctomycetota bacterium]
MSETAEIAKIAELAASNLFEVVGWEQEGGINQDWACSNKVKHDRKGKRATHPTDAVYRYFDPYRGELVYWVVDFKSYAIGSIKKDTLAPALRSMVHTVECANSGPHWSKKYAITEATYRVDGMVFLYNHDGKLEETFPEEVPSYIPEDLHPTTDDQRVVLLGPRRLRYLLSVANDIERGARKGKLLEDFQFFYPDNQMHRPTRTQGTTATLEALLGPFVFLACRDGSHVVYYDGPGNHTDEFKLIFDMLFRLGLMKAPVQIRMGRAADVAHEIFPQSRNAFAAEFQQSGIVKRMAGVTMKPVLKVVEDFANIKVGMDPRNTHDSL